MAVSYKKLWKLLIDKDMRKKDLCAKAGISPASVTKMGKNGHVTTEILLKICTALDCQIEYIIKLENYSATFPQLKLEKVLLHQWKQPITLESIFSAPK